MKIIIIILVTILSLTSCKKTNEKQISTENNPVLKKEESTKPLPKKVTGNSNYLCKINGQDWAYTKASGILSTHARTKKRTALITFKKKLEKGSESIQLTYDADSFELSTVSILLKFPKKDGKFFTCYYDLFPDTRNHSPQSELSGSIDLSDPSSASGVAEIKNINIKYEKEALLDHENAVISVTDLKFTDIEYSDLDKFVKSYKK
ncbi:MAG: hypothetical protein L3J20_11860 [Flavobacteriaceae bacterium]|nr:hypothetical protein [Flavobacteriaceae bacterium]